MTSTRFLQWPKVQNDGVDTVLEPDILDFRGSGVSIVETPSRTAQITINGGVTVLDDGSSILDPALSMDFLNGPTLTADGTEAELEFKRIVRYNPRHIGELNSGAGVYYLVGTEDGLIPALNTTKSISADQIILQPILFEKTVTVDRIITKRGNTTEPTQLMKYCIYQATSLTNLYPGALVTNSGTIDATLTLSGGGFGFHYDWDLSATPITFQAGVLYYIGLKVDGILSNMYGVNASSLRNYLGVVWDIAYNGVVQYTSVATAAGDAPFADAFPDPFTAAQPVGDYTVFAIGMRITAVTS